MKCDAAKLLSELLARIHRDGGHYEDEVGTEKAVQDADAKIVGWLAADSAKPAGGPSIPTNARISAIAARHFTNWPKFPDEVFSFARELIESLAAAPAPSPEPVLTDDQIERHTLEAGECPPQSKVLLVSAVRRLMKMKGETDDANRNGLGLRTDGKVATPEGSAFLKDLGGVMLRCVIAEMRDQASDTDHADSINDWADRLESVAPTSPALQESKAVTEALGRMLPIFEKALKDYVFTADRAGEVAADMNTLRAVLALAGGKEGTQ